MSKLSDKLAGFFGRLFPMSRNKTIKLNNEIRQTESEHFAQLCEMLGFLENSLNTCTDICRDNAEQIKLCRQSLRTLEDNQVKFGEDTALKLKEIKLDIENLKKQKLDKYPKIVVTTNIYSDSVYNFLHKNKIDFIFYKNQVTYSRENVLNTLLLLKAYEKPNKMIDFKLDSEKNEEDKLSDLINKELDLIGVGTHLKGRKYLYDAIYFIIQNDGKDENISVIQFLVGKYKRSNSTISRAMQNAILHAWRISSLEDLSALYTARINYETGVPTPTEFIYYYSDKIKKSL